jgi:hypothetical protein
MDGHHPRPGGPAALPEPGDEILPRRPIPSRPRLLAAAVAAVLANAPSGRVAAEEFPVPRIAWDPERYVCHFAEVAPAIDGMLEEPAWMGVPWTDEFVDILGEAGPAPRHFTRAKLLWDDAFLYVAALLEEPDVWGTLTERDAVIYHDNDFEVFIDPDGDNHAYYELEINALGTVWDLLLVRPYRDGGPAVDAWDIRGLRAAVHVDGTLNDPTDTDDGWSVEIAIPWDVLAECAGRPAPPASGDVWRLNFSRVEWRSEKRGGRHVKLLDPGTDHPLPEDNWVWSPQGLVAMHYPEMWGLVRFSDERAGAVDPGFAIPADQRARWALMRLYHAQRRHRDRHGRFAAEVGALPLDDPGLPGYSWPPRLEATSGQFLATLAGPGGLELKVDHTGRVWVSKK